MRPNAKLQGRTEVGGARRSASPASASSADDKNASLCIAIRSLSNPLQSISSALFPQSTHQDINRGDIFDLTNPQTSVKYTLQDSVAYDGFGRRAASVAQYR